MTKEEAQRIATEAASDVVLHDLPRKLHQAGLFNYGPNTLARITGPHLEAAIMEYLTEYHTSE